MWRCLKRISLALVFLVSGEVLAIGLGDIKLDSALNEPLRAEIELLSATPEELDNLSVAMASSDTFDRYGIDRPVFLSEINFQIVKSGSADGNYVRVTSPSPITEPFLTFLVEAAWSRGRLLREYTVLLDPPTYAPPTQQAPAVQAPSRTTPADSGRIERQPEPSPVAQPEPQREPTPVYSPPTRPVEPAPAPVETAPVMDDRPYDTSAGSDYYVQKGETLWGLASRMRPDSRLTMNQTMLAIFEANPEAFGGNINILRAGASLRIPSADEIYQISRGDALAEVQRQHQAWGSYVPPADVDTTPSLTLVPPDDEDLGLPYDDTVEPDVDLEPLTREEQIEARIAEIEMSEVPDQASLIEIRNSELAQLRQELAAIRGEVYEPPADDQIFVDETDDAMADDELMADDTAPSDELDDLFPDLDEMADDEAAVADDAAVAEDGAADEEPAQVARPAPAKSLVDTIIEAVTGIWGIIGAAVVVVAGVLIWFLRRGRDDVEDSGPWQELDDGDLATGAAVGGGTESLAAPTPAGDDAIVVVEQESGIRPMDEETVESPAPDFTAATGEFGSLEDTFSSETAVNLDQTDPLAEADFHMAYGLYDQAADLVNGALESDPTDKSLLAKLCEIYFVWGNRDAFVDAAGRLKSAAGGGESADWDKIVIMGQQIAGDHQLFAGASAEGATRAVDLAFDDAAESAEAVLDMDLGGGGDDDAVDFMFGDDDAGETTAAAGLDMELEATAEAPTVESSLDMELDVTAEMPTSETTLESPTVQQPVDAGTAELPSLDADELGAALEESAKADDTSEINLDDLGLDVDVDALGDFGEDLEDLDDLADTTTQEVLNEESLADITGKNPEVDPDETGVREALDPSASAIGDKLDMEDALSTTGEMRLAPDETGASPLLDTQIETDTGLDLDLLEATGRTQILSDDLAVDTGLHKAMEGDSGDASDADATMLAPGMSEDETVQVARDEDATMLAPGMSPVDAGEDFDFAKTEALPKEAFTGDDSLDPTREAPAVAATDVDLDLDDLTAALAVSQAGDTVDMPRDDATVEQPRPSIPGPSESSGAEVDTVSLGPDDINEDLNEARTMTEVGTKLDLARAYVDMGDPAGARSILEEVLDEGDAAQRQQAQQLLDSLPS